MVRSTLDVGKMVAVGVGMGEAERSVSGCYS